MGKASSKKKVARVAGTGGGRTSRGRSSWTWFGSLTLIAVLGVGGVVLSRNSVDNTVEPPTFQDHWHTAYAYYICGEFRPPLPEPARLIGIHTHTDGLIHVEPTSTTDTGSGATVGRWVGGQPGLEMDARSITLPGENKLSNGDKCGDEEAQVQVMWWDNAMAEEGRLIEGDPKDIKLADGALVTFAFVPEGTEIPKPPTVDNLANPNAFEPGGGGQVPTPSLPEGITISPDGDGVINPEGGDIQITENPDQPAEAPQPTGP